MKALVITEHSPDTDCLRFEERPTPEPGPGQAQVRVHAVSLNHLDTWVRRGLPGHRFPLPIVPGSDGSGVVSALGPGASTRFAVGDAVVIAPGFGCGQCARCDSGDEPLCPDYGIRGESCDGLDQEFVCVPEAHLLPKPTNLSFAEAAAMPLVFLTAWHMLIGRCNISPGQTVLVHAAASGVSSAAIQIAHLAGCRVLATASQEHKLALATRLGADHTINYAEEDWLERARELTGDHGVDVVVDHVGVDTFGKSISLLRKGGAVVTCGTTSGPMIEVNMARIFFLGLSILGSTMGSRGELHRVMELAAAGKLRPVIDSVLPWEEVAEGHRRMGARDIAGKIVLELVPNKG